MQSKLIKAWGPYAAGTLVVDNKTEEAENPGSLRVSPARFAKLQEDGHFAPAEPARPIPAEVRTSNIATIPRIGERLAVPAAPRPALGTLDEGGESKTKDEEAGS